MRARLKDYLVPMGQLAVAAVAGGALQVAKAAFSQGGVDDCGLLKPGAISDRSSSHLRWRLGACATGS
jgi:hypothetical protein